MVTSNTFAPSSERDRLWRWPSFFLWHYWSRRLAATATIPGHGVDQRFLSAALSWRLSNTLEADFCVEALEEALGKGRPDIFNTDQGAQFTIGRFVCSALAGQHWTSCNRCSHCYSGLLWRNKAKTLDQRGGLLKLYFPWFNSKCLSQYTNCVEDWFPSSVFQSIYSRCRQSCFVGKLGLA